MSGTSLDGLDLALCRLTRNGSRWNYSIDKATTLPYTDTWTMKLTQAHRLDAKSFLILHKDYGRYIGENVNYFIASSVFPDFVSSHGHTVFHEPSKGLTFQLGDGAMLAATCGITTISDFRSFDIALGGQGAPLVPVGDEGLFGEYDYCLNLGGFANISFRQNSNRIAYDICPVNTILNYLSQKFGFPFDKDGNIGRIGHIINSLLRKLDAIAFYATSPPKSLGREWLEQYVLPLFDAHSHSVQDQLRTVYQHIVNQISANLISDPSKTVLVTGGGALNLFLVESLRSSTKCEIKIPADDLIHYKEALIFAFLGALKIRNEINCLSSVTGARTDTSSGVIYTPQKK
jgi:anhydro-N-acetylmuramic acid kinase